MGFAMKAQIVVTAKRVGQHYNIPWQLIAGVACLVSGYGTSLSAKYNYVGLKYVDLRLAILGFSGQSFDTYGSQANGSSEGVRLGLLGAGTWAQRGMAAQLP